MIFFFKSCSRFKAVPSIHLKRKLQQSCFSAHLPDRARPALHPSPCRNGRGWPANRCRLRPDRRGRRPTAPTGPTGAPPRSSAGPVGRRDAFLRPSRAGSDVPKRPPPALAQHRSIAVATITLLFLPSPALRNASQL